MVWQAALEATESYSGTLARSMGLVPPRPHLPRTPCHVVTGTLPQVLDEFYSSLKAVGVSAVTGAGMAELFGAIGEARAEFIAEYRPGHICTGTSPHLHRDLATSAQDSMPHPHRTPCHICTGTSPHLHRDLATSAQDSMPHRHRDLARRYRPVLLEKMEQNKALKEKRLARGPGVANSDDDGSDEDEDDDEGVGED
jgi:hypothetical protein